MATALGGVQVLINGKNAFIYYVQPAQQRNAVDIAPGDFSKDRPGIQIDHDDFFVMRDIQAPAFAIGC
jgi:hypothetical protein